MSWSDTVMVPSGTLLPGDVLAHGGEIVLGRKDPDQPYEKLIVLTPEGRVEHRAYGRHFNMSRMRRTGEMLDQDKQLGCSTFNRKKWQT